MLVGSPDAQASVVSVEPPNLQGIPVVELNAGAPGPLESASSVAALGGAGKREANGGVPQSEAELPTFVPSQAVGGDEEAIESVSAPIAIPTLPLAPVMHAERRNAYVDLVEGERTMEDDGQRAQAAKPEWERLAKDAASLGLEPVNVPENGNCILEAARITAGKLGVDVGTALELRIAVVELMRCSLDSPTGPGTPTLGEQLLSRANGALSKDEGQQFVEDTLDHFSKPGTFLEQTALPSLAQVLDSPIVVIGAAPTCMGIRRYLLGDHCFCSSMGRHVM
jgi:hypothetical protein